MKPKRKWAEISGRSYEVQPARIVSDAAIATGGVGDGRLIPLVIVDTSDRPDVEELVRVHQHLPPGDVACQWGHRKGAADHLISLVLRFVRPAEVLLLLEFDIVRQGGIVDQIVTGKGLYLQPGRDGDRLSSNPGAPKILIEVPDTGFKDTWDDMLYKQLTRDFKRRGLSRHQAKAAARNFIREWRDFGKFRIPNS